MNCRKAQQWISRDLDGELGARRKARLDMHLGSCEACRGVREQWSLAGARLRETRPAPAQSAEAAWADVRRAIRNAGAREPIRAFLPVVRWATVAALLVLLVGVGATWRLSRPPAAVAEAGTKVEWAQTDLPGASPMVYEDAGSGLTVIWVVEADNKEGGHAGS